MTLIDAQQLLGPGRLQNPLLVNDYGGVRAYHHEVNIPIKAPVE
jgi:hypothetical protein